MCRISIHTYIFEKNVVCATYIHMYVLRVTYIHLYVGNVCKRYVCIHMWENVGGKKYVGNHTHVHFHIHTYIHFSPTYIHFSPTYIHTYYILHLYPTYVQICLHNYIFHLHMYNFTYIRTFHLLCIHTCTPAVLTRKGAKLVSKEQRSFRTFIPREDKFTSQHYQIRSQYEQVII